MFDCLFFIKMSVLSKYYHGKKTIYKNKLTNLAICKLKKKTKIQT